MRRDLIRLAALGAGVASLAHVAPALTSWRRLRCSTMPRLAGVGRPSHVALTFDDGPDPRTTPEFLDALDELGWRASFFLLGDQVRRAPRLAAEIAARGHEVGVHGDRHVSHLRRPLTWTVADIRRARDLIADTTGQEPRWFRPPYGAVSASTLSAARASGLELVLWTSWGRDWRPEANPETVADEVMATFRPGATVLLHDSDFTCAPGSWRAALGALPLLASRWRPLGLDVGPLAEHHEPSVPVGVNERSR
jgi:peptidoglycan/xylan/chitin deacetylase (PgdA/CDA1 family)